MNIFMLLIPFSLASPPDTAEYRQYEKENVALYRKKFEFIQPEVKLPERATDPVVHISADSDPSDTIRATWNIPDRLVKMYDMHHPAGDEVKIAGFRVQIYAGPNYDSAKRIKAEFVLSFNEESVYDTWESPHFRVRAGDFLSRNEAMTFANRIKDKFPGAFVVPDVVKMRKAKKLLPPDPDPNPEDEDRITPPEE